MIQVKQSIYYIVLILLLISCNTNPNDNREVNSSIDTIRISQKEPKESILFPDTLFGGYDCIALETTKSSLIGNIDELWQFENVFYILDKRIAKAIFLFDSNGVFLKKIQSFGKGPGEYLKIECVNFNISLGRIEIFDSEQMKIIFYDFQGEYINEIQSKINFDGFVYNNSDSAYYFYSKFIPNYYDNYRLIITDKNFKIIKGLLPFDKDLSRAMVKSISYFYNSNDDNATYLLEPYSNVIYELRKRNIIPRFYIDFEKNKIPNNFLSSNVYNKFDIVEQKEYSYVSDFIINGSYIYLEYNYKFMQNYFQYQIDNNKKNIKTIFGTVVHNDFFSIVSIDAIVNDSILTIFDVSQASQKIIDQINKAGELGQEISKTTNSLKAINPIILKCKIKKY